MRTRIFLLTILMMCIFQSEVSPLITSRIQGVVRDAETGEAIGNAAVLLFSNRILDHAERKPMQETTTDKSGKFVFDDVKNDRYFVMCKHEDYLYSLPERLVVNGRDLSSKTEIIELQQGQIKYLVIDLIKGGKIKGRVLLKKEAGVSGANYAAIFLENKMVDNKRMPMIAEIDDNGNFTFESLIPDDNYHIKIEYEGFPIIEKDLSIKKGQATYIEHIFDATDNTGVFGTVTKDDEPYEGCRVRLYSLSYEKSLSSINTDINGKYKILNVQEGDYEINFSYLDSDDNFHHKEIEIKIKKNELKEININIDF